MKMKQMNVRFPESMLTEVRVMASREGVTPSVWVRRAVDNRLKHPVNNELIERAIRMLREDSRHEEA